MKRGAPSIARKFEGRDWELLNLPTLCPDAMDGPLLRLDMLPPSTWYSNLRTHATKGAWSGLAIPVAEAADYRCEICGHEQWLPSGKRRRPDCHELWRFELQYGRPTQRLERLIALCPSCHETQHAGRAHLIGRMPDVYEHLGWINGWTVDEGRADFERAWERFDVIADSHFDLDLRVLAGRIEVAAHPSLLIAAADREESSRPWSWSLARIGLVSLPALRSGLREPTLFDLDEEAPDHG